MNVFDDPEVRALFVDESVEALHRVEKLLLQCEAGVARADWLATAFRDFHTIKGTAALLGYEKVTSVSHAAEDVMSALRDGVVTATVERLGVLMLSVDALREMIESARDTATEGDLNVSALLEGLKQKAQPSEELEPAAAPESATGAVETREGESTVRMSVAVLDRLVDAVAELAQARNQLLRLWQGPFDPAVAEATRRLTRVTRELSEHITEARLQPMARALEQVPRLVRDLTQKTGKQARCVVEADGTEIDRAIAETIRDPLLHIVRNAMDHGLETPAERVAAGKPATGTLTIRSHRAHDRVVIEVRDDGRGISPEKMKAAAVTKKLMSEAEAELLSDDEALALIFRPGFSTASKVTDLSGRGVGMDVVRTSLMRAGGSVSVASQLDVGTTVTMSLPMTLAIAPALLVEDAGQVFAVAQAQLEELLFVSVDQPRVLFHGQWLPVVRLSSLLGRAASGASRALAVLSLAGRRVALAVESVLDTEELMVKPLHPSLQKLGCYSGAGVLADGRIALMLDVAAVAERASQQPAEDVAPSVAAVAEPTVLPRPTLLKLAPKKGTGT